MRQGVEVFMANGRKILQADAAIYRVLESLAAIDGNLVSTRYQPGGDLFGEGFESTVIRGDAARANRQSNPQSDGHAYIRADFRGSVARGVRRAASFSAPACLREGIKPACHGRCVIHAAGWIESGGAWPRIAGNRAPESRSYLERSVLPQQAAQDHRQIARGDGNRIAAIQVRRDVFDAHQEARFCTECMLISGRQRAPVTGQKPLRT